MWHPLSPFLRLLMNVVMCPSKAACCLLSVPCIYCMASAVYCTVPGSLFCTGSIFKSTLSGFLMRHEGVFPEIPAYHLRPRYIKGVCQVASQAQRCCVNHGSDHWRCRCCCCCWWWWRRRRRWWWWWWRCPCCFVRLGSIFNKLIDEQGHLDMRNVTTLIWVNRIRPDIVETIVELLIEVRSF